MELRDIQSGLAAGKNLAVLRNGKAYLITGLNPAKPRNSVECETLDTAKGGVCAPETVLALVGSVDIASLRSSKGEEATVRTGMPMRLPNGDLVNPGEKVVLRDGTIGTYLDFVPGRPKFPVLFENNRGERRKAAQGYVVQKLVEGAPAAVPAAGQPKTLYQLFGGKEPETQEEILREIAGIWNQLSPENISADGERSMRQIQALQRELMARKRTLEAQLGRSVSEDEAFQVLMAESEKRFKTS